MAKINHVIYFSPSQLLFVKPNEDRTSNNIVYLDIYHIYKTEQNLLIQLNFLFIRLHKIDYAMNTPSSQTGNNSSLRADNEFIKHPMDVNANNIFTTVDCLLTL